MKNKINNWAHRNWWKVAILLTLIIVSSLFIRQGQMMENVSETIRNDSIQINNQEILKRGQELNRKRIDSVFRIRMKAVNEFINKKK